MITRTDWAMAQQVTVTAPAGATVVISGGPTSTTGAGNVEHFAIRGASSYTSSVGVYLNGVLIARDSATVTAQPSKGSGLKGVHTQPTIDTNSTVLNALPTVGACALGIAWSTAQPSSATWDSTQQSFYDTVFTDLHTRGMKAIVSCGTTPAWARSGGTNLTPPTNPSDHGNFVASIVSRWGADILCIEPWNETNLDSFWSGTDTQYVNLVDADHTALAGAKPLCLGPSSLCDYTWFDGLFSLGLTGSMFDWVAVHPYPFSTKINASGQWYHPSAMPPYAALDGSPVAGIHKIESVLASHGVTGRNLVVGEFGVSTNAVDPTNPQLRMTDADAASWEATVFDQLLRIPQMQAVCMHEGKDEVDATGWNSSWGAIDRNGNRRARWATLSAA